MWIIGRKELTMPLIAELRRRNVIRMFRRCGFSEDTEIWAIVDTTAQRAASGALPLRNLHVGS